MRQKGKLTSWNDDKGFGFIAPFTGGERVFVHLNGFVSKSRKPVLNQVVTYSLSQDKQGRVCAIDATHPGERLPKRAVYKPSRASGYIAALFGVTVTLGTVVGFIPILIFAVYSCASVITYCAFAADKTKAKRGDWRIQESTLQFFALAGGWPGALLAQQILRHKSKKRSFKLWLWLMIALNCSALVWLVTEHFGQVQLIKVLNVNNFLLFRSVN